MHRMWQGLVCLFEVHVFGSSAVALTRIDFNYNMCFIAEIQPFDNSEICYVIQIDWCWSGRSNKWLLTCLWSLVWHLALCLSKSPDVFLFISLRIHAGEFFYAKPANVPHDRSWISLSKLISWKANKIIPSVGFYIASCGLAVNSFRSWSSTALLRLALLRPICYLFAYWRVHIIYFLG